MQMINNKNKINENNSNILKASEIGQYHYCSISWKLIRDGYKPSSTKLKKGINNHFSHGKIIENTNYIIKRNNILLIISFILLFIALLIIFFEVIF